MLGDGLFVGVCNVISDLVSYEWIGGGGVEIIRICLDHGSMGSRNFSWCKKMIHVLESDLGTLFALRKRESSVEGYVKRSRDGEVVSSDACYFLFIQIKVE